MTTPSTSSSCECGGEVDEACVYCGEQLHSDSAGRIAGCDNQHHEFKPVSPSQIENLQEIITRAGITSREALEAAESEENKGG